MAYLNAFEALGLDKEDATVEALRADLAGILRDWIKQGQLTQAVAGHRLGVSQGVVSEIINGQTGRKSVEYFIRLLARVDVAWTARCWHAPSDASAVKGQAPESWIAASGTSDVRAEVDLAGRHNRTYWEALGRGGCAVSTSASDPTPTSSVRLEGARHG